MTVPSLTRLLAGAILIVTVSTQPVFLLGAGFLRIGPELGFGPAGLGVLTALFFLAASAASTPMGRVVERIGWQPAIRVNAIASSAVSLLIALTARDTVVLGGFLVLGGCVYGLANPAANQALADHVDPRRRALIFGLKHAGIPSSTLVAGLAVPALILSVGWRWAYVAAAGLALTVAAGVPRRTLAPTAGRFAVDVRRIVAPMTPKLLTALAAASTLATWAAIALSTYLVAAAVDIGFSESAAGLLLFAGSAASIGGRVLAGAATDWMGGRGFGAIAVLTGVGAGVFVAVAFAGGAVFGALVLAAFATGWGWPGLMTYTVVNANSGSAASSSAITQAGIFVGAGLGPIVLGAIIDTASFAASWLAVAVALAAASVSVAWVGRRAVGAGATR